MDLNSRISHIGTPKQDPQPIHGIPIGNHDTTLGQRLGQLPSKASVRVHPATEAINRVPNTSVANISIYVCILNRSMCIYLLFLHIYICIFQTYVKALIKEHVVPV